MMKKKNIVSLLLSLLLFTGMTGCKDDNIHLGEELTYLLCSNAWIDYYYDENGVESEQILEFDTRGYGWETIIHYYRNGTVIREYQFYWTWEDSWYNSIYMEYGANDYLYFDDIILTQNRLGGYFGGEWINFRPYFP